MIYEQHSGKGKFLETKAGEWNHKERFTHSDTIGIYRSKYRSEGVPTNTCIIHYSKRKGWHIVPANRRRSRKMIEKHIALLDQNVVVTCTDGKAVHGRWIDCLDAEDAGDDERQEDSILIQNGDELIEIYESEIKAIQKAHI